MAGTAAGALRRASGLRSLPLRQKDRKTHRDRGAHRAGRRLVGPLSQAAARRPRPRRCSRRLEGERVARRGQARRRHLETAPAAMGTILGRGAGFGPARSSRARPL